MQPKSKFEAIKQILSGLKEPAYRYKQITDAIFRQRIAEFERMSMLPRTLRDVLIRELGTSINTITPVAEQKSRQVSKLLFALNGGEHIEAVRLSYKKGWESYCISSQCGCGFACRFCATGSIGLKRNLTADEITGQLLYFYLKGHPLDSVAFMGMGEALANPHLFEALQLLTDPQLFGLGQRRITVSTIGILPGMARLAEEFPQINLTFSLHSPFDEERSRLMPINERYPLGEVLEKLDRHIRLTGRKVYIAYILLRGINDSDGHAEAVARLLRGRGDWEHLYHVTLIPYNHSEATRESYGQADGSRVRRFLAVLKSGGVQASVRTQFGSDIDAACGQLYASEKLK
ncbi:Ribosomal RNA large subunit methyltransferase Cfr [compost metagenome]